MTYFVIEKLFQQGRDRLISAQLGPNGSNIAELVPLLPTMTFLASFPIYLHVKLCRNRETEVEQQGV